MAQENLLSLPDATPPICASRKKLRSVDVPDLTHLTYDALSKQGRETQSTKPEPLEEIQNRPHGTAALGIKRSAGRKEGHPLAFDRSASRKVTAEPLVLYYPRKHQSVEKCAVSDLERKTL